MSFTEEQFGLKFGMPSNKKESKKTYIPKKWEVEIWKRQKNRCACKLCNHKKFQMGDPYFKDHKLARGLDGPHTLDNIQFLCPGCNAVKNRSDMAKIAEKNRKDKAKKQKQKKDTIEML